MENFVYHIPTKAFFGKGQIENLGAAIKEFGGSRVLLAYGGGSIRKNGIYEAITAQLKDNGLAFIDLDGIKPNPPVEDVNRGIRLYRENNLDFILAAGGGSTIDACKGIAAGVSYDGDIMDLLTGKAEINGAAPLASILTMAGTGSEMNSASVITAGEAHKKYPIFHPELTPKFSILDPAYTFSVPANHSAAGCSDILSHLMEHYFLVTPGADAQDGMNEGLMRATLENSPKILENPEDYDARSVIMWASSMALAGFQLGLGKPFAFPVHFMGHELSSLYDMTHGVTLALLTPAWMRHTIKNAPEHLSVFARFARNVFDVQEADESAAAEEGIQRLIAFYESIGMPKNLKEAGVEEDRLEYLAEKATENGNIAFLTTINKEEALEIFREAF